MCSSDLREVERGSVREKEGGKGGERQKKTRRNKETKIETEQEREREGREVIRHRSTLPMGNMDISLGSCWFSRTEGHSDL